MSSWPHDETMLIVVVYMLCMRRCCNASIVWEKRGYKTYQFSYAIKRLHPSTFGSVNTIFRLYMKENLTHIQWKSFNN